MIAPMPAMDNDKLQILIESAAAIREGRPGLWQVDYRDRILYIITDETHDRMRVMTPVIEEADIDPQELRVLLAANFDRALDAKFALADDYLWAVFMHPLGDLTARLFLDAMEQVAKLADNYGGSFSSSNLFFGGP